MKNVEPFDIIIQMEGPKACPIKPLFIKALIPGEHKQQWKEQGKS